MGSIDIFDVDVVISIRFGENENWILNSVVNVDRKNDIIEIIYNKDNTNKTITKGNVVDIKVGFIDSMYVVRGYVEEVIFATPCRLKVRIESIEKLEDKRNHIRYNVKMNALVKQKEHTDSDFSIITNISKTGICLIGKGNYPVGADVFVDAYINEKVYIKLKGMTVRKKVNEIDTEYGLIITPIDYANEELLNRYIDELESKQKLVMPSVSI